MGGERVETVALDIDVEAAAEGGTVGCEAEVGEGCAVRGSRCGVRGAGCGGARFKVYCARFAGQRIG